MIQGGDVSTAYRDGFELLDARLAASGPDWRRALRAAGMESFATLGFPTHKHEDWKYCDLGPLRTTPFRVAAAAAARPPAAGVPDPLPVDGASLVLVDGRPVSGATTGAQGVTIEDLAVASRTHRHRVEPHLGRVAGIEAHAFRALNTAFLDSGAFVHVPAGVTLATPISICFVAGAHAEPLAVQARLLVVLEDGARATLVEDYTSCTDAAGFTNAVTEIVLGAGASLDYTRVQRESTRTLHVASIGIDQGRDSTLRSTVITSGGRLTRNDLIVRLAGRGAACQLYGLVRIAGQQFADDHTWIRHEEPDCTSSEDYRAVLDDRAEGVFNGLIHVSPGAQRTASRQSSHNLLLSDHALMNTKPELQIHADDVKCSHGATIGQLDEDALFYLRSRGLDRQRARDVLVHAFGADVVGGIRLEALRRTLAARLFPLPDAEGVQP